MQIFFFWQVLEVMSLTRNPEEMIGESDGSQVDPNKGLDLLLTLVRPWSYY